MPSILLLGFMGSGKSAVARTLSRRVELPFVDLDLQIEREIGISIANFFAREGEEAFRNLETEHLKAVLAQNAVISPGGGLPTRPENREILKSAGETGALVVYLRASAPTLAARIRLAPGKRPLIDGDGELDLADTQKRVEELLIAREPFYVECANFEVATDDLGIMDVARTIEKEWKWRQETLNRKL